MRKALMMSVALVAASAWADGNPPWAKCTCEEPSPLPAGTSWAGGELSFTNRAANGGASFDFAALGLTFVGGADTVLKGIADKSVFDGLGSHPSSLIPPLGPT